MATAFPPFFSYFISRRLLWGIAMRVFRVAAFVLTGLLLFCVEASAQFAPQYETVAITEFMTSPIGQQDSREWVELYNFGKEPVNIKGFRFSDGKNDICDLPDATIKPGDFVIVVVGHDRRRFDSDRKTIFEAEWLGGKADPRVVAVDQIHFNLERADAIILQNRRRTPIWMVGWTADDRAGMSTYLAIDNFNIRSYGDADKPAVNRAGNDGTVLGYEGQQTKKEDVAWTSDVSKLEAAGGFLFKAKADGGDNAHGVGSPLKGNYKPMP
ncbi:MAG: hypothetical protein C0483_12215 [Pirellula sp.]|nr:hypothetical protein [Pirellula sp.]